MDVNPRALALIGHFEQCKLKAYLCPARKPTIGFGMTYYPDGHPFRIGDTITRADADAGLLHLIAHDFAPAVAKAGPATPDQFGAMVALAYNIGAMAFAKSTVAREHKAGRHDAAAAAFARWNKTGTKVLAGLVRRRAAEAALYLGDHAAVTRLTQGEVK